MMVVALKNQRYIVPSEEIHKSIDLLQRHVARAYLRVVRVEEISVGKNHAVAVFLPVCCKEGFEPVCLLSAKASRSGVKRDKEVFSSIELYLKPINRRADELPEICPSIEKEIMVAKNMEYGMVTGVLFRGVGERFKVFGQTSLDVNAIA